MLTLKDDKKISRGEGDFIYSKNIICCKWYNNKSVLLLGKNVDGMSGVSNIMRKTKSSANKTPVCCPNIITAPHLLKWKSGDHVPSIFVKLYFVRFVFLEIPFCVTLQGIRNFFGLGTPRILLWILYQVLQQWFGCRYIMDQRKLLTDMILKASVAFT